ncbi:hypothetical protein [Streptomyces sp. NPDC056105]|uniref:hypothetical protein n=1 Tax=Streptomyces sp. NPDC056105 TaxID=3345714 RepID=UPI0035DDF53D
MAMLTLAEAKAQLDIETGTDDVELQAYIDGLGPVIERYVGPVEIRTVTEQVDGWKLIALTQAPVVSLVSLTPVLDGGLAVSLAEVTVNPDSGVVRRRDGAPFYGGPWTAVYSAGRVAEGGDIPPTISLAARILLQHLWRTQYGSARGQGSADDFSVTEPIPGFGYAVPNRVLQLLEAYKVTAGIA